MGRRIKGNVDAIDKKTEETTVRLAGNLGQVLVGGGGKHGKIRVRNKDGENRVEIDGKDGDVRLIGADCAELMKIDPVAASEIAAGSVLVIGPGGLLRPCDRERDHRVAGVVAGAGSFRPGIVLGWSEDDDAPRRPVTAFGQVECRVDASYGAISAGDLLTTSPTSGHAMRVDDPREAVGAILGKALADWEEDRGSIPILAVLQ